MDCYLHQNKLFFVLKMTASYTGPHRRNSENICTQAIFFVFCEIYYFDCSVFLQFIHRYMVMFRKLNSNT